MCYLKNEGAVGFKRWLMNTTSLAAYGVAPPAGGRATLTALRDTVLKKSELSSGYLPATQLLPVKKGAVWGGIAQMGDYWLVSAKV